MAWIRKIIGSLILFWERYFPPQKPELTAAEREAFARKANALALYQFQACPFCVIVRRELQRLGVTVPLHDALHDPQAKKELIEQGGKHQVPCLRIKNADGPDTWLYESSDIVAFLRQEFARASS